MSISDIVIFPYVPIEIYKEYKAKYKTEVYDSKTLIKSLKNIFINAQKGEKISQTILFDFYVSINHSAINKDKGTGKRIEDRLSILFALSTGDAIKKKSSKIENLLNKDQILLFDKTVLDLICKNNSPKGDLFFFNGEQNSIYKLSVKSVVTDNTEINFGAFEFKSTIKGIEGLEDLLNLQERKRTIKISYNNQLFENIGIGSSKQMSNMLDFIKAKNKEKEYIQRFSIILRGVFKDDFLVYLKDNTKFEIYVITNNTFINFVLEKVLQGFKSIRMEGNSIRVSDIKLLKSIADEKLVFDLKDAIPDYDELETILLSSDHSKLSNFRRFITV